MISEALGTWSFSQMRRIVHDRPHHEAYVDVIGSVRGFGRLRGFVDPGRGGRST
jgi:hypothetical protein